DPVEPNPERNMIDFGPIYLPENYNGAHSLESLLPGDTAFVFIYAITQDSEGRGLFVDTNTRTNEYTSNPVHLDEDTLSDTVGVMRVLQQADGQSVDGYIIDITDVKPGEISRQRVPQPEDVGDDEFFDGGSLQKWTQILGLRYTDAEGDAKYIGPDLLEDSARFLGEVLLSKKKCNGMPRTDQIPNHDVLTGGSEIDTVPVGEAFPLEDPEDTLPEFTD
ncbi:MAG: hypothetical protein ACI9T8_000481, partial [Candidatus Saccharimonadales bacterium]